MRAVRIPPQRLLPTAVTSALLPPTAVSRLQQSTALVGGRRGLLQLAGTRPLAPAMITVSARATRHANLRRGLASKTDGKGESDGPTSSHAHFCVC